MNGIDVLPFFLFGFAMISYLFVVCRKLLRRPHYAQDSFLKWKRNCRWNKVKREMRKSQKCKSNQNLYYFIDFASFFIFEIEKMVSTFSAKQINKSIYQLLAQIFKLSLINQIKAYSQTDFSRISSFFSAFIITKRPSFSFRFQCAITEHAAT